MIKILQPLSIRLLYDEAWMYCLTLSHDGRKDWRLPTQEEFEDYGIIEVSACYDECGPDAYPRKHQVQAVRDVEYEIGPRSAERMLYSEALTYCSMLELNGKQDWRLPTYYEHAEIYGSNSPTWYQDEPIINSELHGDQEVWHVEPIREKI